MTAAFGIAGWSGGGKTTLIERLIPIFIARGLAVGVLKHAHHSFDIDKEGKDSRRFRDAGCSEVAISSARRWAFIHECGDDEAEAKLDFLLQKFDGKCDLVLVEGYKNAPLPKVEVWRESLRRPLLARENSAVAAVAADVAPPDLPPQCALLPLHNADAVADFIVGKIAKAAK